MVIDWIENTFDILFLLSQLFDDFCGDPVNIVVEIANTSAAKRHARQKRPAWF